MKKVFQYFFIFFTAQFYIACARGPYIPIGVGHQMHICGNIVDENLNPIYDSLTLELLLTRPLFKISGQALQQRYGQVITDSKFCIEATYAFDLTAWISGKKINSDYMGVSGTSIWRDHFKWVVERREQTATSHRLQNYHISVDSVDRSWGFQ